MRAVQGEGAGPQADAEAQAPSLSSGPRRMGLLHVEMTFLKGTSIPLLT